MRHNESESESKSEKLQSAAQVEGKVRVSRCHGNGEEAPCYHGNKSKSPTLGRISDDGPSQAVAGIVLQ